MIPQFKQGGPTEKTRWYPPQIVSLAPEFTVAADRFCEYAHRLYALPIVHGEGGIVLEKDGARADRYHLECGERIVLKAGSLPSAHWGLPPCFSSWSRGKTASIVRQAYGKIGLTSLTGDSWWIWRANGIPLSCC